MSNLGGLTMERKDAWTDQDDSVLAEAVLKHIREGSTQLTAFQEASERLGRTSGACGFRWNKDVRKGYEEDLKQAKLTRKDAKNSIPKRQKTNGKALVDAPSSIAAETPIEAVRVIAQQLTDVFNGMQDEIERLRNENVVLKKRLEDKPEREDLNSFLGILERARSLGFLDAQNKSLA
jgi:prespore-specific regulator